MKINELALRWSGDISFYSYPKIIKGYRSEISVYLLYWITDSPNRYVLAHNEQVILISDEETVNSLYKACI